LRSFQKGIKTIHDIFGVASKDCMPWTELREVKTSIIRTGPVNKPVDPKNWKRTRSRQKSKTSIIRTGPVIKPVDPKNWKRTRSRQN
jgi:hypothetical protein